MAKIISQEAHFFAGSAEELELLVAMAEQQEASSVEGKQEPPVLPVSSGGAEVEPGVNIKVDEAWQVSCMPEEKQYFSQDVS